MRNVQGYAQILDPASPQLWERDTCACGHCGKVIFTKPGTVSTVYLILHHDRASGRSWWTEEPGAFCRVCMRPVCLPCHDHGGCRTVEALLEALEGQRREVQVHVPRSLPTAVG